MELRLLDILTLLALLQYRRFLSIDWTPPRPRPRRRSNGELDLQLQLQLRPRPRRSRASVLLETLQGDLLWAGLVVLHWNYGPSTREVVELVLVGLAFLFMLGLGLLFLLSLILLAKACSPWHQEPLATPSSSSASQRNAASASVRRPTTTAGPTGTGTRV
ncbi:hypothetical protein PG993_007947 [Apiospora rasikravindrae]|uniref:Uncharacterized protein n=1 Tax=Apiospora rasikravindrae TaxID=990691 RepID=A0ABR1SYY6_9PEZI